MTDALDLAVGAVLQQYSYDMDPISFFLKKIKPAPMLHNKASLHRHPPPTLNHLLTVHFIFGTHKTTLYKMPRFGKGYVHWQSGVIPCWVKFH